MRTIEAIRSRFLTEFNYAMERPWMLAGSSADVIEVLLQKLLGDLCFLDGQDAEWAAANATYVMGCRWVRGHFEFQHLPFPGFVSEVASVYAEVAYTLGYFSPKRLLSKDEMVLLDEELDGHFFERDWTETDLHNRFGAPSHQVGGVDTRVVCYGGEERKSKWVFFDLSRRLPNATDWFPDPRLRDVRRDPLNRMHLLPFGNRLASGTEPPSPRSTPDR